VTPERRAVRPPESRRASTPVLVVLAGRPGVGKSYVARRLAARTGAVWLRVDTLEAAMLSAGLERSPETGLAAYLGVRDQAREMLSVGQSVIIDAVNGIDEARAMWRELARTCSVRLRTIDVTCPDPVEHRRRVEDRPAPTPPLEKPTWDEVRAREYQPWTEPVLSVDTTGDPETVLAGILRYLDAAPRRTRGGRPTARTPSRSRAA